MTAFWNYPGAYRPLAGPLNEVCKLGGPGTAQRIARGAHVTDGQISAWRRGKKLSQENYTKVTAAIIAEKERIEGERSRASQANGAAASASSNGHDPSAADFVRAAVSAAPAQAPRPFVVRSFADLRGLPGAQPEMVIDPWLPVQASAMVYGWRGTGKSLLALALAISIATGTDFLKWRIPKAWSVAYIDGEMSLADLASRYEALVSAMGFEPINGQLRLLSMMDPEQPQRLNLADPRHHDAIQAAIGYAEVVIIDSSVSAWAGKESEAWPTVQSFLLDLRQRGKTVIFLHQAGKDREQRDLSDHEDLLHTSIQLAPPRRHQGGAAFTLTFEKHRGFFGADAEPIKVALTSDGWSWSAGSGSPTDAAMQDDNTAGAEGADDQHSGRARRLLCSLPDDHWQVAPSELKLNEGAVVIERRVLRAAYSEQWPDDDGTARKPETVRKAVERALNKLEQMKVIKQINDGSRTWITRPSDGVP
jgi:hypothetical protein